MLRVPLPLKGHHITVEVWELDAAGLVSVLEEEPPGLTIGQVKLQDGVSVFGVLAEPWVVEGQHEITRYGGWREYMNQPTEHTEDTEGRKG
jgi:hypothetical protein